MSVTDPPPTGSLPDDRTVIGPLTTKFTPPASCSIYLYNVNFAVPDASSESVVAAYFSNCASLQSCLPGLEASTTVPQYGFYSPGLMCPESWIPWEAPAAQLPRTMFPDEELVLCCPVMDILYDTGSFQLSPWRTVTAGLPAFCAHEAVPPSWNTWLPLTYSSCAAWATGETGKSDSVTGRVLVVAPAVQLNWRPEDKVRITASTSNTQDTTAATQTVNGTLSTGSRDTGVPRSTFQPPSGSSSPAPPAPPAASSRASHLTIIAMGAVLGAVLLVAVTWFVAQRIRRRKSAGLPGRDLDTEPHGRPELEAASLSGARDGPADPALHELMSLREAVEMECSPTELEGMLSVQLRRTPSAAPWASSTVLGASTS